MSSPTHKRHTTTAPAASQAKPRAWHGRWLAPRLAVALACACLLATLMTGCAGGSAPPVTAPAGDDQNSMTDDNGTGTQDEGMETASAGEDTTVDTSAQRSVRLYNWVRNHTPDLRGRSYGEVNARVRARMSIRQALRDGKVDLRGFNIEVLPSDRKKGDIYRMWAATSKPATLTLDRPGHAIVTGTAYLDRYADRKSARAGDYMLDLEDNGNASSPRDHVRAYYRTGSNAEWRLVFSFDCTYQGQNAGDLVIVAAAAKPW
jgi:hypothetical protein